MIAIEDANSKHQHKSYYELTKLAWQKYCDKNNIDFVLVTEKLPNATAGVIKDCKVVFNTSP